MRPRAMVRASFLAALAALVLGVLPATADDVEMGVLDFPTSYYDVTGFHPYFEVRAPDGTWAGAQGATRRDESVAGRVRLTLPAGHYRVSMVKIIGSHYASPTITTFYPGVRHAEDAEEILVTPGRPAVVEHFEPVLGASVRGKVATEDGSPVTGPTGVSRVEAVAGMDDVHTGLGPHRISADVDESGNFTIDGLDDRSWAIRAIGPGTTQYGVQRGPLVMTYLGDTDQISESRRVETPGTSTTDVGTITMIPNGTLAGRVVDVGGTPLSGMEVKIEQIQRTTFVTDDDGRWDAGPVVAGTYLVSAVDPTRHFRSSGSTAEVVQRRQTETTAVARHHEPLWSVSPSLNHEWAVPVGEQLVVDPGQFVQDDVTVRSIEWWVTNAETDRILGRGRTFVPTEDMLQYDLQAFVTVERKGLTSVTTSNTVHVDTDEFFEGHPAFAKTPVVHQLVTADPEGITPDPSRVSWQWLRDGKPIAGATSQSYRTTAADQSHRVSVRATARRTGVRTTTLVSTPSTVSRGRSTSTVSFSATGSGRVSVSGRVTVPRVDGRYVDGKVVLHRLRGGSTSVGSLKVVDGKVSGTLRSQPTGKRTYWAVFVPDRPTMKGSTSARDGVRVR